MLLLFFLRLKSGRLVYGSLLPKDEGVQAYNQQRQDGLTAGIVKVTK